MESDVSMAFRWQFMRALACGLLVVACFGGIGA